MSDDRAGLRLKLTLGAPVTEIRLQHGQLTLEGERPQPEPQARIPVQYAYICLNCDVIYDGRVNRQTCAGCGSEVRYPLPLTRADVLKRIARSEE